MAKAALGLALMLPEVLVAKGQAHVMGGWRLAAIPKRHHPEVCLMALESLIQVEYLAGGATIGPVRARLRKTATPGTPKMSDEENRGLQDERMQKPFEEMP